MTQNANRKPAENHPPQLQPETCLPLIGRKATEPLGVQKQHAIEVIECKMHLWQSVRMMMMSHSSDIVREAIEAELPRLLERMK